MINERLDIIVPTRNRFQKLIRMLKSIPQYSWMELHIICDGDTWTYNKLCQLGGYWKGGQPQLYLTQHMGSVHCRNLITQKAEDAILWATDDIIFEKGCIESAWDNLKKCYPDGDGVVGFNQHNAKPPGNFCWTGVGIMGQSFLKRYPGKVLSFPGYFHFGTREIERLALKVGRLYKDPLAKIHHFHPDFYPALMDETHIVARSRIHQDMTLKKERKEQGLIWGFLDEGAGAWKP